MNKRAIIIILLFILLALLFYFFLINNDLKNKEEKFTLGYCPTIKADAHLFSEKDNYSLIEFESAALVLDALNQEKIDLALIGRKAKESELLVGYSLEVLKSGETLVSKNKNFIDISNLSSIEVYTYIKDEKTLEKFNYLNLVFFEDKEKVFKKVLEGKVVLISWDDWTDDLELFVVYQGLEKVKDFRGVFLYSYK